MKNFRAVLAYGCNDFLIDANTCAGIKLNSGHKGEWPLAFYLIESTGFDNRYNIVKVISR
jgi:hypothetical protein